MSESKLGTQRNVERATIRVALRATPENELRVAETGVLWCALLPGNRRGFLLSSVSLRGLPRGGINRRVRPRQGASAQPLQ